MTNLKKKNKNSTLGLKSRTETNQTPVDDVVTGNENVLADQKRDRGINRRSVIVGNVISRGNSKNWGKHLLLTSSSITRLIRETYGNEQSLARLYKTKGDLRQMHYPGICRDRYLAS